MSDAVGDFVVAPPPAPALRVAPPPLEDRPEPPPPVRPPVVLLGTSDEGVVSPADGALVVVLVSDVEPDVVAGDVDGDVVAVVAAGAVVAGAAVVAVAASSAHCWSSESSADEASARSFCAPFTLSCLDTTVLSALWQALTADDTAEGSVLSGSTPIAEHTDVAESRAPAASEIAESTSCWAAATPARAAARPSGASAGRSASARVTAAGERTKDRPAAPPTSELTSLPAIASARISWALSSAASFDRTVTSRSAVSSWASCWPVVTVSPTATSTVVTVPELGKATSAWTTGWIVATPSSVAVTACWLAVARRYAVGFAPVVWATARPPP